jgi:uncharacterized RDD family membrane protein YckC
MADIACRSCGTMNDVQDHRCARCGRRLHMAAPPSTPDSYPVMGRSGAAAATAPVFESFPGGVPTDAPEHVDHQPSLFRGGPGSPKVVPIPTLTPLRPSVREGAGTRRVSPRTRPNAPRARTNPDSQQAYSQQALDLQEEQGSVMDGHASGMVLQPGSAMHRELNLADVPVALPTHRMLAAAVDMSIVVIALGLFLGVYSLLTLVLNGTSDIVIDRQTLPLVGAATVLFALFYRALWCLANGDTPGMRFAGLRLVDFDGRSPDREQRCAREVAAILSLAAAGLGLVWALVDEESLTWHDHISKTFPTPA